MLPLLLQVPETRQTRQNFAPDWRPLKRPLLWLGALALLTISISSCAVLAWVAPLYGAVSNFSDPACSQSLSTQLVAALWQQGETAEDAADEAGRPIPLSFLQRR